MKILITGGAGFIGSTLCEHFLKKGHEVTAFDNLSRSGVEFNLDRLKRYPYFNFIKGDICSIQDMSKLGLFDGIYHFAANPAVTISFEKPRFDFEQNIIGTFNILEFAREKNIPVIFASTNKVYPVTINDIPMVEKSTRFIFNDLFKDGISTNYPVDGQGKGHAPYGVSKLSADLYCQEYFFSYDVPVVVFRFSCIYGPYQRANSDQGWIAWFSIAKVKELPIVIFGNGKQVRDCLYGEDLARLLELILINIEKFKGKVYNVGGGIENSLSLIELVDFLDKSYPQYRKLNVSYEDWRLGDQKIYISDIKPLANFWKPEVAVLDGVKKTFKWVEENKEFL